MRSSVVTDLISSSTKSSVTSFSATSFNRRSTKIRYDPVDSSTYTHFTGCFMSITAFNIPDRYSSNLTADLILLKLSILGSAMTRSMSRESVIDGRKDVSI